MTGLAPVRLGLLFALAAVCAPAAARSAAGDVVTTTGGLALEGSAERLPDGALRVTTEAGEVLVPAREVASHVPGEGPLTRWRKAAAAAPADSAAALYQLALQAQAEGLAAESREALLRVLALEPDHLAARRALGHERVDGVWRSADEAARARGLVLLAGAWRLPEEVELAQREGRAAPVPTPSRDDARLRALLREAASGEPARAEAAERALASAATPDLVAAALGLLGDGDARLRAACCRRLGEWGDESALRALVFHGARDQDEGVRREAVLAAASFGHDDVAVPYVRALGSENARLVANAAQALGLLADVRTASYVVKRLSSHGSSGRNFVAFLNQISYVRDYDVEIAQASNIANPNIGTISEGVVLDVQVKDAHYTDTWIEPYLLNALGSIVGRPFADASQARAWYAAEGARLPDFPKAPSKRAPRRAAGRVLGVPAVR